MVDTKRKKGRKITTDSPEDTYRRNRQRYYYQLTVNKINTIEFNKLMDKNLEEFHLSQKNKSLKEF